MTTNRGEKAAAIREAFRALGRDAPYMDVIRRVSFDSNRRLAVTRQQVFGVRNQISSMMWRGWDDERARAKANGKPAKSAPAETKAAQPQPAVVAGVLPPSAVKFDGEIIALLNTCVDKHKLARLLTAADTARLDELSGRVMAFDPATLAFGLVAFGGGFCACHI